MRTRNTRIAAVSALSLIALGSAGCASSAPEVPTESPAPITFDVGSRPDFAKEMISCLSELGWDVTTGTDGGFSADVPNEQFDVYEADRSDCEQTLGYDTPPPTLSDAQIRDVYPHMLWEWKCLDENGFEPENPPTEQAYIDDYHEYGALWTPYSQYTSTLSDADLNALFDECPRAF